jgi:replicative DNA helicase
MSGAALLAVRPEETPAVPLPTVKYSASNEFDAFFQAKIAAMTLRDMQFLQRTDGLVDPDYFENQMDGLLVDLATTYFRKYNKVPSDTTIYGTLIRERVGAGTMKPEMAKMAIHRMVELFKVDISDRDYVVDRVATFARHQAVTKAMVSSINKLDKGDFESIEKAMKSALQVGAHVDHGAYDFGDRVKARLSERLDILAGRTIPAGITTGHPGFDCHLYHKGWGRRELAVIMGGAKAGKTTALINFGIAAMAASCNVLYVTLEVSADIIAERMDASISEQLVMELGKNAHTVREKVEEFIDNIKKGPDGEAKGKFVIHEFPTGTFMVRDLRRLIERYKGRGLLFDLVVIDYADLMAPERYTESSVENSKSVYVNLRGFAMQENVAVLTATQTNRSGFTAAVAKAEHVADDFNKIRIADVVISINTTDEERSNKQARLFFAACRNQPAGFAIKIAQDIDRMKFIKSVLGIV